MTIERERENMSVDRRKQCTSSLISGQKEKNEKGRK